MALFDLATRPLDVLTPIGLTPLPGATGDGASVQPEERHGALDVIGAAFENENSVVSAWRYMTRQSQGTATPGYNPWNDIKGTPYEAYWSNFTDSDTPQRTQILKQEIDQENENRRTLAAAGFGGTLAAMAAGIIDPTILIPVGGEIKAGAEGTWSLSRGALAGARAGLIGSASQEAILQATQEIRPVEDSAVAIGSSVILGALLGTGGAALMNRTEQQQAATALRRMAGAADDGLHAPTSGGAAATPAATLDDLSISSAEGFGGAADKVAGVTQVNPNLRANFRAAPAARQYTQELAENTLYQTMHDEGRSLGPAAETLARSSYHSRMLESVRAHNTIFSEMKKAGPNMTRQDFEEAVGAALRNGDEDPTNPYVTRAAKEWRERVFEPFKNDAVELGLLPPDVSVDTAASYFTRVYNREKLTAREGEFKDTVANYYEGLIANDHAESKTILERRVGSIDQEIADLRLDPKARTSTLANLESQGKALDEANVEQVDRVSRINDLRKAQKAAKERGDTAAENAARAAVVAEQQSGGSAFTDYLKARRGLRTRQRRVDLNYAGMNQRFDTIVQSLVDLEEGQVRTLTRIARKGRELEQKTAELTPDKFDGQLASVRGEFNKIIEAQNKADDRIAQLKETAPNEPLSKATLAREEKLKPQRTQRLVELNQRIETLENLSKAWRENAAPLDPAEMATALRELNDTLDAEIRAASNTTLARGEKAQRLKDRLDRLDPETINARIKAAEALKTKLNVEHNERWQGRTVDEGIAGASIYRSAAQDIANEVFDKITGRAGTNSASALPDYLTPITRGPLKDRTFNIPDALIKDFLDSNVMSVGERYGRTMAGEIELTRKFGRADMRDQIKTIRDQYRDMRAAVDPKDEAKLKSLAEDETGALRDLEAMRDLIRGTYKASENASNYGRLVRSLMAFNYLRSMGGVIIANWSELYRPAMVHGLGRYMSQGVKPLLTNMAAIKLSIHEAQLAGQVTERVLQNRLMSMGEIGDPYRAGTAVERVLQNSARVASRWNGIVYWTDGMKAISSVLSQNRILEGATGAGKDKRFLAYLGIDQGMAGRISEQFAAHGETLDNVRVANTQNWTDQEAVRTYRAAVSKDVDSIIVTKSVGDVPLFVNTPTGKMLMQFRNYMFASHSRLLLRGMQESKAQFISGLIGMSALGAMGAYARSWRGGKARFEKFQNSAKNPGYLIGEGLDLSGLFALPVELGNTVEKLTQPTGFSFNPVKTPLLAAGKLANPSASMQGNSSRFAARDPVSAVLGPTASIPMNAAKATGAALALAQGKDPSKADINAATSLIPFGSYLGMREMVSALAGDSPFEQ